MKKLTAFLTVLAIIMSLGIWAFAEEEPEAGDDSPLMAISPASENDDEPVDGTTTEKDYSHLAGTSINVYNWGEYISDGKLGSLDINKAFEEKYGIKVIYNMFSNNEEMYTKVKSDGVNYDIVIPSDYMIQRMISEDLLQKLDFSNIPNYSLIASEYKNLPFDPENEYSVPYLVGLCGLIYNTKYVLEEPDSWAVMWDEQYSGKILTFNNERDAFSIAQFLLGQDVNSTNPDDWNAAFEKLKEQKPLIQNYVMDEIFDKMEGGEAYIAPYYAGDFLSMSENNGDLAFVFPREDTNIFVDSMCIPKSSQNKEAAELYINFMLEPEIALENAEYVCYASPNTAVLENEEYSLKDNEFLYPSPESMPKTQYFEDLPPEIRSLMSNLFTDLKIEGGSYTGVYIALGVVAAAVIVYIICSKIKKKRDA